ncbi:MAG: TonB-dependent receptor [Alphaproteobacteria bacterium]|nr:TonB-dependent receptor [Alphaproteobacteria bacterium]
MSRSLFLLASAALTAVIARPVQAQELPGGVGAPAAPEIVVVGTRADLLHIPGSGATIEQEDLERSRVFTVNEALRQVAGVFPRDEEGLGLRPNIGIRGLSPIRSSKTLLLEDGLPLTYGPYGDNASYSHPPIRRFQRIEVLKGASQIRFGPQTVGGVVNYITPETPGEFEASMLAAGGSGDYGELDGSIGGQVLGTRLLAHANYTQFDGIRANHGLQFDDIYLKADRDFGPNHSLTARIGRASESSQVSYSGLTEAEYAADPYGNPFPNDRFETERFTASATHGWNAGEAVRLTTSVYSIWFDRDWWRQSSNSSQRPNDTACGGMANISTTCGNEGRLREYNVYGVESRLGWKGALFGAPVETEIGARYHTERQNRLQLNGTTPDARTGGRGANGGVAELNLRYAEAVSGWATAQATFGRLRISPGVRIEQIDYERINKLTNQRGESDLTEVIPGLGVSFDLRDDMVIYGGVHRGFAPPRTEDIITNAGGVVDLDAEKSVNYEIGLRGEIADGVNLDVAAFLLDFENQIVPASVAGGAGATLTSAGETQHTGLEASFNGSLRDMGVMDANDIFFRTAITWLAEAGFEGRRFSNIAGFATTSVSGNRLPYSPEWIASVAVGYAHGDRFDAQAEVQYTGGMFADDLNTVAPVANGQRGLIPDATIFNLSANLRPFDDRTTVFVTVKNVFDEVYIVDRARGILPGAPRLVQAGLSLKF